MTKLLIALASVVFVLPAFGQTPQVASTPDTDDVVRISTSLVQIDVTVVDGKGNPITDIKPDEIQIFQNGERQKISNLSFVTSQNNSGSSQSAPADTRVKGRENMPPPVRLVPSQVHRAIALVVDDLTLSFESTVYVKSVLRRFVDNEMQDGDLVAIIRTGSGIGALQQFTSDKRMLYAAIDRIRWNAAANGRIGTFGPILPEIDQKTPPQGTASSDPIATTGDIEKQENSYREDRFATGTLGALSYVIRGMKDLPGRKSVMLMSEGFRLYELGEGGLRTQGRVISDIKALTDAANRAAVVLYTLDPRGLTVPGLQAMDFTFTKGSEEVSALVDDRDRGILETQDGLRYLAEETGGFAIVNQNNLSRGIRKILDNQSYYLVGYEPDSETFGARDVKFNSISVKVSRPGAHVRYRSGFYGVDDDQIEKRAASDPNQRLREALASPFAVNDIPLRLNALFNYDPKTGEYVRSLVHINTKDLVFKEVASGRREATFDVVAVGYGDNGVPIGSVSKKYTMTVTDENYRKLADGGFVYDLTFPIKKAGAYQLRVAIRDHANGNVGAANQFVEVPDLKKGKLMLSGIALATGGQDTATSNPLTATALRQFASDAILEYGSVVFNAKSGTGAPQLSLTLRVFNGKQVVFSAPAQTIPVNGQAANTGIAFGGRLELGGKLPPGDYVLELAVTDAQAKEKSNMAVQYVDFEVGR